MSNSVPRVRQVILPGLMLSKMTIFIIMTLHADLGRTCLPLALLLDAALVRGRKGTCGTVDLLQ